LFIISADIINPNTRILLSSAENLPQSVCISQALFFTIFRGSLPRIPTSAPDEIGFRHALALDFFPLYRVGATQVFCRYAFLSTLSTHPFCLLRALSVLSGSCPSWIKKRFLFTVSVLLKFSANMPSCPPCPPCPFSLTRPARPTSPTTPAQNPKSKRCRLLYALPFPPLRPCYSRLSLTTVQTPSAMVWRDISTKGRSEMHLAKAKRREVKTRLSTPKHLIRTWPLHQPMSYYAPSMNSPGRSGACDAAGKLNLPRCVSCVLCGHC
jgi:hypothetical protein